MKTKHLWSLALVGLFTATGCSNEETVQQEDNRQTTENATAFVSNDNAVNPQNTTRTSGVYGGKAVNFYWSSGDKLWIKDGTLKKSVKDEIDDNIAASETGKTNNAKFYFPGIYTADTYLLRYTGNGNESSEKVTIKATQNQQDPNDAKHLGTDGDCGTATAQRQADGTYKFTLDHKASYLTFMPYYSKQLDPTFAKGLSEDVKVTQIKVSADQALCGTYGFDDTGIKLGTATSTANSVTLTLNGGGTNGFTIPTQLSYETNAAIMVIAPGEYTNFTVEYTLHDQKTKVTGTVKKNYGNIKCNVGKNRKIAPDLDILDYSNTKWAMWDASHTYWQEHEWQQPRVNGETGKGYATAWGDPRWHSTAFSEAQNLCKDCPNANEMMWYMANGDAHWDETTIWTVWGHLYKNGMWFLKKNHIIGFRSDQVWDGRDWRTNNAMGHGLGFPERIKRTAIPEVDKNKYFYLPAIENMDEGNWAPVGEWGTYWTSTPTMGNQDHAYSLIFGKNTLTVHPRRRLEGDVCRKFE